MEQLPHNLVIAEKEGGAHYWAINRDIEQEGRFVTIDRSCDHFAIVRLRLEIDFGDAAVVFVNAVDESQVSHADRLAMPHYVGAIIEGIRTVLPSLSPDGLQIRALRITLVALEAHDVDTKCLDFTVAAAQAMTDAVQKVGLSLGPT